MDARKDGSDRDGRRKAERRGAKDAVYAGLDRRSGNDRRKTERRKPAGY